MPAALRHRRGSLPMLFMPIILSVCRQRADAILAARIAIGIVGVGFMRQAAVGIDECGNAGVDGTHHAHAQLDAAKHRQRQVLPRFGLGTEP